MKLKNKDDLPWSLGAELCNEGGMAMKLNSPLRRDDPSCCVPP